MVKPSKAEFSLIIKEGMPIEDAKEALHSLEEKIEIVDIIADIIFYCKSPSAIYESLFDTKLVEKDCNYRHWKTRKLITHKYITTENEPRIPNSLEDYFKSVGKVGVHRHLRYSESQK